MAALCSPIRAICFDAVGTLIDPKPSAVEVYCQVARQHGLPVDADQIGQRFRRAVAPRPDHVTSSEAQERAYWRQIVAQVFAEHAEFVDRLFDHLWEHFAVPQHWQVRPEVAPLWSWLEQRGIEIGIASNFDQRLTKVAGNLPPLDRCRWIFPSSDVGFRKPSLQFFRTIEQRLSIAPTAILMVGDDYQLDVVGARQAGWQAVWLDSNLPQHQPPVAGAASREALDDLTAAAVRIRSLDQLCTLLSFVDENPLPDDIRPQG